LYSLRQSERAGISVCIGDEFCLLDYLENLHSLFRYFNLCLNRQSTKAT